MTETVGHKKCAIVLLNMGGPDSPETIQPFLENLFRDPAIMRVPGLVRPVIAWVISRLRLKAAKDIYATIGGRSPLLEWTEKQANALQKQLMSEGATGFRFIKTFVGMRYWKPLPAESVAQVKAYNPDLTILVSLFPQYSTTTAETSLKAWYDEANRQGLTSDIRHVCCYPTHPDFIRAHVSTIRSVLDETEWRAPVRLLFSAHSLPERTVIETNDPYPDQVQATVETIMSYLDRDCESHRLCYQSKLGPIKWLEPRLRDELRQAGEDGVSVLIVPIAFVSEHVETLVELDHEHRDNALAHGVVDYQRAPALGVHSDFINCLADVTRQSMEKSSAFCGGGHQHFAQEDSDCSSEALRAATA